MKIIDIENIETLPFDFDPVICFTTNNDFQVLMLIRYTEDIENFEWETQGLKPNKAFPIDYVTHWDYLPEEPKSN